MDEQEKHEMKLTEQYESGAEKWECPICGRKFILSWPPNYKKIILRDGDLKAIHTGSRVANQLSLSIGSAKISSTNDAEGPANNDAHLSPWVDFINTFDINQRLDGNAHDPDEPSLDDPDDDLNDPDNI